MKFAVVILAFVAVASAQLNQGRYNPFSNQYTRNQNFKPTVKPYRTFAPLVYPSSTLAPFAYPSSTAAPRPAVASLKYQGEDRNAQTLKYGNEVNPDGSYAYFYETDNGIAAQAQGTPRNFGGNPPVVPSVAQGSFSWISPEGKQIVISYVADENGYQPSGDAIPTSPPLPPQIARALAYVAKSGQVKK